jgi:hypothetical protein
MRKYCGFVLDRMIPFDTNLISRDGFYSDKNLYCKWKAINRDKDSKIFFNLTINEKKKEEKYHIEIIYFDGSINSYNIDSRTFYVTSSSINYIIFHFYTPEKLYYSPFIADFGIFEENNLTAGAYLNIVFISGVAIFGCVILTIFLHKCSSIIFQHNNNSSRSISEIEENVNNNLSEDQENNDRLFIREENMKKRNQEALDKLFLDENRKEKFEQKIEKEFCANCTICMEDYFPDSDVFTLNCRHTFHPNCLKNWLSNILLYPKCPNCNKKILESEMGENEEDSINVDNNNNENDIDANGNILIINRNQLYLNRNENNNFNLNLNPNTITNPNTIILNNANRSVIANAQRNEGLNRSINHMNNNSNLRIPISVSLHSANLRKNNFDEGLSILSNINMENNEIFLNNNNQRHQNNFDINENEITSLNNIVSNNNIDDEYNNNSEERMERNNFVMINKQKNNIKEENKQNTINNIK